SDNNSEIINNNDKSGFKNYNNSSSNSNNNFEFINNNNFGSNNNNKSEFNNNFGSNNNSEFSNNSGFNNFRSNNNFKPNNNSSVRHPYCSLTCARSYDDKFTGRNLTNGTKFQNQTSLPSWISTVSAMLEGKRPWIRQPN
ncbi:10921_t:CDS:2, partial [Cetraspora pellucida]